MEFLTGFENSGIHFKLLTSIFSPAKLGKLIIDTSKVMKIKATNIQELSIYLNLNCFITFTASITDLSNSIRLPQLPYNCI